MENTGLFIDSIEEQIENVEVRVASIKNEVQGLYDEKNILVTRLKELYMIFEALETVRVKFSELDSIEVNKKRKL